MQTKILIPAVISLLAVLQTSPIAHASPDCESRSGNSVVVNIGREDHIGGLAIRAAPNPQAPIKTVIPAAGTGVAIGSCHGDGWCEVTFECVRGWSLAARYLAPRDQRLYRVTNVSPNDPEGLNVRSGPGLAYSPKGNIPYNGDGIVLHDCQADGRWCLVTYGEISGWSARQLLAPMTVAEKSAPAPQPPPVYTGQAPAPAPTYAAPPTTSDDVPVLIGRNTIHAMVMVGGRSLGMLVDTGATNGSLPTEFADQLIRDGAATESEQEPFKMANGAIETGRTIIVNTVMIGNHTIHDIRFGVGGDAPLLGLNALEAVSGSFKIDHDHGVLSFS